MKLFFRKRRKNFRDVFYCNETLGISLFLSLSRNLDYFVQFFLVLCGGEGETRRPGRGRNEDL